MPSLQLNAIRKEEYCGKPYVYTPSQGEDESTSKGCRVAKLLLTTCFQDFRKWKGSPSEIGSQELASRLVFLMKTFMIRRVDAVTACLQAGILFAKINFIPTMNDYLQ